jgi:hypothetical protein
MVSDRKLKYFVGRIKAIEQKKVNEIAKAFPENCANIVDAILGGNATMRTKTEIKALIVERNKNNRYGCSSLNLEDIFDVEAIRKEYAGQNEHNKIVRTALIEKLKEKTEALIDITYFGDEPLLMEKLKEFASWDATYI